MSDLLAALEAVSAADLEKIDAEVKTLEARLAALTALRRVVCARLGLHARSGPRPKPANGVSTANGAPRTPGELAPVPEEAEYDPPQASGSLIEDRRNNKRRTIARHLAGKGPQERGRLIRDLSLSKYGPDNASVLLAHEWFAVNPDDVVALTPKGRAAAGVRDDD